jgi:hypothetical protein
MPRTVQGMLIKTQPNLCHAVRIKPSLTHPELTIAAN